MGFLFFIRLRQIELTSHCITTSANSELCQSPPSFEPRQLGLPDRFGTLLASRQILKARKASEGHEAAIVSQVIWPLNQKRTFLLGTRFPIGYYGRRPVHKGSNWRFGVCSRRFFFPFAFVKSNSLLIAPLQPSTLGFVSLSYFRITIVRITRPFWHAVGWSANT